VSARWPRPDTGLLLALLIVVVLGGSGLVLAADQSGWFSPSGCGSASCGNGQLPTGGGPNFVLGQPTEATQRGDHWYNFTIIDANDGIQLDNLGFRVVSASGATVTPGEAWSLSVVGSTGAPAAAFAFTGSYWASSFPALFENSQTIVLYTGAMDLNGQGMDLDAFGIGTFQGSISAGIP
jgi:hypothetical protein